MDDDMTRVPAYRERWEEAASLARAALAPLLCLGLAAFGVRGGVIASPADWARYSVHTPAGPAEPSPELFRKLKPLVYSTRTLHSGEWNIWSIARDYGTTVPSLQATNNNELVFLRPGMAVTVHNKKGMLYLVRRESEGLDEIVARFRKDPAQARELKRKVIEANGFPGAAWLGPYALSVGESVLLPEVTVAFDTYQFPFHSPGWARISSGFGSRLHPILKYRRFHDGLDLPKPYGTPVYPSRSGRVVRAGWLEGYGNMVEVRHADGASTRYGHLSQVLAAEGQPVQRGKTLLGRVGSSGLSTGPHLHFEVRDRYGRAVNPRAKFGRR